MTAGERPKLIIQRREPAGYRWLERGAGSLSDQPQTGDLEILREHVDGRSFASTWLLVPALNAPIRRLEISSREMRYARRTIPFRLEDQLLQDVDSLHFASGSCQGELIDVVVLDRQWLRAELDSLDGVGITPTACFAEQSFLPAEPESITHFDGSALLLREAAGEQLRAFDIGSLPLVLERLHESQPDIDTLLCLVEPGIDTQEPADIFKAAGLQIEFKQSSLLELAGESSEAERIDLLQGDFAPRINWRFQWRHWRVGIVAILAAMVLQTGASALELYGLKRTDRALRGEVQQVYRDLFPQGMLVDPRKQMRDHLQRLRTENSAGGFMQAFYPVGGLLAKQTGLTLHSLRFDGRNGDLRLDVSLPSHADVEKLRNGLATAQRSAELQSSTASGNSVRARLAIR